MLDLWACSFKTTTFSHKKKVGVTFAIFQSSGTLFIYTDWLWMLICGCCTYYFSSFNSCGDRSSSPVDLLVSSLSNYIFTLCSRISPTSRGSLSFGGGALWGMLSILSIVKTDGKLALRILAMCLQSYNVFHFLFFVLIYVKNCFGLDFYSRAIRFS